MIQYSDPENLYLDRVTQTLVELFHPRRVVLFGSRARGTARRDSDYDIMIETESALSDRSCLSAVQDALGPLSPHLDLKVRSVERFAEGRDDPGRIDYHVAREGRELYRAEDAAQAAPPPRRVREQPPDGFRAPPSSLPLWIAQADTDFVAMEQLRVITPAQWPSICFHAHEAIEKLLKSVILSTYTPPPRIHALSDLQSRCPEAVRSDAVLRAHCVLLDAVFPRSRYPDDGPLGQADADAAIAAARAARSILMSVLP